jgi:hypothetical protein
MHDCTFRKLARHTHVFTSRGLITKGLENEKGKKSVSGQSRRFLGFQREGGVCAGSRSRCGRGSSGEIEVLQVTVLTADGIVELIELQDG